MKFTAINTLLLATTFSLSTFASPPGAPSNVTLIKYSLSTAELFWDRVSDADGIKGYELSIDGSPYWVGDVTSHLDSSLPSDSHRVYRVVAVDNLGNRSGLSAPVIAGTGVFSEEDSRSTDSCTSSSSNGGTSSCSSSSSSQSQAVNETTINTDHQEQNSGVTNDIIELSAEVYSPTALELFWNKPQESTETTEFHIIRNGDSKGFIDGNSYFDRNLSPGTDYHYKVDMIQNGNDISSDSINVRTRGTTSSSSSSSSRSDGDYSSTVYGETYSASAIEIFWETSAEPSTYSVYRNGAFLGSYDARSYYDGNLDADTVYRYEVYSDGEIGHLLGDISLRTSK